MSKAQIIQGDENSLRIIEQQMSMLTNDTIGRINPIQEPKGGLPMSWSLNGEEMPRAVVAEEHILPTQMSVFEEVKGEWIAGLRTGKFSVASFTSGMPIVFDFVNGDMRRVDPVATVCFWLSDLGSTAEARRILIPIDPKPEIPNDDKERARIYRNANPYLRKYAEALCATVLQSQQDGSWVDTTTDIIRETAADKRWCVQFVLPWIVKETKHVTWPDGSQYMLNSLSPALPTIGFDTAGLKYDPFAGEIHALTKAFTFTLTLNMSRFDDLLDAGDEDSLVGCMLLQYMGVNVGMWECLEQTGENPEWPHFEWNQPAPSYHTNLCRAKQLNPKRPENSEHWEINDADFVGDGFPPSFRERIMKSKRYGNRMEFFKPTTLAGGSVGDLLPHSAMLVSNVLETYSEHESSNATDPDDEWGESSRFVPAWKDKRKLKLIDKAKGTIPYWSDVVRCSICNGRSKVYLKEQPVTVIFDCPHCGEGGSIDCSYLQPDKEWPAEKKRKKVDLK